jgi:NAD(P)-dependent dehydrogenase (short-subunit alcohol dehydrogenase family)
MNNHEPPTIDLADSTIDLSGRTALVTGSTKGIGHAAAAALAGAGATVVVTGRRGDSVAAAVERITALIPHGPPPRGHAVDLATASGCAHLAAQEPNVDILVNNVGIFDQREFTEVPDEVWEHYFQLNVMSGVRLARSYVGRMERAGWGRVLFIASESAFNIPGNMIHYGMTKVANVAVANGLAKRMAGTGVTVNSILPGPTLSEGLETMIGVPRDADAWTHARDFVHAHRSSSLLQRAATVEEVARLILYVASPWASATTGAALRVEGGVTPTLA